MNTHLLPFFSFSFSWFYSSLNFVDNESPLKSISFATMNVKDVVIIVIIITSISIDFSFFSSLSFSLFLSLSLSLSPL